MGWPKGVPRPRNAGRQKGTPNKLNADVRGYIQRVACELAAEGKGLLEWARENPGPFWTCLYAKLVPRESTLDLLPTKITLRWESSDDEDDLSGGRTEGDSTVQTETGAKTDTP